MQKKPAHESPSRLFKSRAAQYLFAAALLSASIQTFAQTHSGIPEIDSLPLHDWQAPTEPLSYSKALAYSALLPGGGQIYGHHPVRGGFLIGMETLLTGLALSSEFSDIPHWKSQARKALDSADALFQEENIHPENYADLEKRRENEIDFARQRTQVAAQQSDLMHSEFAWAIGLHAYGIMDAMEIAYLSNHQELQRRSVHTAFFRGLFIPGGGQLYNLRYGKFGMLWMAFGASAVSAYSRQQMVSELNDRIRTARAEGTQFSSSVSVADLEKDRTLYRKRRNQYFWGIAIFYMYSILDGMVDASLSDFDAPERFAVGPTPSGGLALEWHIPF